MRDTANTKASQNDRTTSFIKKNTAKVIAANPPDRSICPANLRSRRFNWIFTFRNGQKIINDLANRLSSEVSDRIEQHLDIYLETPQQINQINATSVKLGHLNLQNLPKIGQSLGNKSRYLMLVVSLTSQQMETILTLVILSILEILYR
ncbi:hypothetical protein QT971_16835 [Microcoleus sp. herbarium19]|uniref:hypothetical protein n=1 Tax=unclassified Microcoleus TaxID=2642155 RepID=UPI002FCF96A5